METKEMTKKEKYEEAKRFVSIYLDFKGDKRTKEYKNLQRSAPLWVARLNNFAKQLGLPNYGQLFFEVQ